MSPALLFVSEWIILLGRRFSFLFRKEHEKIPRRCILSDPNDLPTLWCGKVRNKEKIKRNSSRRISSYVGDVVGRRKAEKLCAYKHKINQTERERARTEFWDPPKKNVESNLLSMINTHLNSIICSLNEKQSNTPRLSSRKVARLIVPGTPRDRSTCRARRLLPPPHSRTRPENFLFMRNRLCASWISVF